MLTYRPVNHYDLPLLATFPQNEDEFYFCYPKGTYPFTPDQLIDIISHRCYSTVIEKEGVLADFANFYQWQHQGLCKIGNVMVNPIFRQQGIARYLLSVMIKQAVDIFQAKEIQVSCFNTNTAALLFYPKIGFLPISIEERYDKQNQKIALIHFSKIL